MKKTTLATVILATLVTAPVVQAYEKGDWVVRGGFTTVAPDDESSNIFVGESDLGVDLTVDSNTQLGLNVAYFITDNINIEVLAATPFTHDVDFGVEDPLGSGTQLGEVTHLPPTITVNYYFNDPAAAFQPYVGAGLNYTFIYDEAFTSANDDAGLTDLSLDNSFGVSAQFGADFMIDEKWHINGSVRWIDIDTEATFKLNGAEGEVADIQIDPWVYTISIGYTF
ncbi:OmpW family outer membrane protein [Aestuariibacter sp. A3R04]|uniref:OmpW family outer membrane protein n=1 Tax=Aestuariibacter sp. A3R04 TaxID=2841571 RepID=UPI001C09B120|nr:OmpW family outer membrane protein [Aestuariibacter sp. A3R04]MBU3020184.1 outer membrane beta-barrel protein [Aestuariibacter sp. A3R04]